jgi:hypothetical protein
MNAAGHEKPELRASFRGRRGSFHLRRFTIAPAHGASAGQAVTARGHATTGKGLSSLPRPGHPARRAHRMPTPRRRVAALWVTTRTPNAQTVPEHESHGVHPTSRCSMKPTHMWLTSYVLTPDEVVAMTWPRPDHGRLREAPGGTRSHKSDQPVPSALQRRLYTGTTCSVNREDYAIRWCYGRHPGAGPAGPRKAVQALRKCTRGRGAWPSGS